MFYGESGEESRVSSFNRTGSPFTSGSSMLSRKFVPYICGGILLDRGPKTGHFGDSVWSRHLFRELAGQHTSRLRKNSRRTRTQVALAFRPAFKPFVSRAEPASAGGTMLSFRLFPQSARLLSHRAQISQYLHVASLVIIPKKKPDECPEFKRLRSSLRDSDNNTP